MDACSADQREREVAHREDHRKPGDSTRDDASRPDEQPAGDCHQWDHGVQEHVPDRAQALEVERLNPCVGCHARENDRDKPGKAQDRERRQRAI